MKYGVETERLRKNMNLNCKEKNNNLIIIKNMIEKELMNILDVKIKFDSNQISLNTELGPIFYPKTLNPQLNEDQIILGMTSLEYWAQLIYQLSHELTHYAIYVINNKDETKIKWIEETICEAMSIYFLSYFKNNWSKCELSKNDQQYSKSISLYIAKIVNENIKISNLEKCNCMEELKQIDLKSETNRKLRKKEMIELYEILNKRNIKGLLYYRNYSEELLLESDKYIFDYKNNEAVKYICDLCDKIKVKLNYNKLKY